MIYLLQLFLCRDRSESLQRKILRDQKNKKSISSELLDEYNLLVRLTEKHKHQKGDLSFQDSLFLARYYNSFKNEKNGKSVFHLIPTKTSNN